MKKPIIPAENVDEAMERNPDLKRSLKQADIVAEIPKDEVPSYKIFGTNTKVPVSSKHGNLWKARRDQAFAKRKNDNSMEAMSDVYAYYDNMQINHRNHDGGEHAGNDLQARKYTRSNVETENIVFSNTSALVPAIYARNPKVEVTEEKGENRESVPMLEALANVLLRKKAKPGINLKPLARRSVVNALLTNIAYIEVGYTFKNESSEKSLDDLRKLSTELIKAKDSKTIREIEGRIYAIEERVSLLRPAGPWAKFRRPDQVLRDVDSTSEDFQDDNWLMIWEYVSTNWLNAVFGEKDENGEYKSAYEPSHVLSSGGSEEGTNSAESEINQYTLLGDSDVNKTTMLSYGYDDEFAYRQAFRTKVWYVWDRTTRRVYMYGDNNWKWPIWVWNDPYNLDTFYPLEQLTFYTHPLEGVAKGEVVYYLDQQDAINEINSEFKKARQNAKHNIVYDINRAKKEDVEKIIKGDEAVAVGIDVPEGMTLKDFLQSVVPPSMQYSELFNKDGQYAAIDRISSVSGVMRGAEFKTNTTNRAIEQYNTVTNTRLDEKIDAVEDFIGGIGWKILQMCLQYMPQAQVVELIGESKAQGWVNMTSKEISAKYQLQTVGGSTQKPTTQAKKEQALEVGQILGQFANSAPQTVTKIMLKLFESSFEEINITQEDWAEVQTAVTTGADSQLAQQIESMPPPAKAALGKALAQGVPFPQAMQQIMAALENEGGNSPPPATTQ